MQLKFIKFGRVEAEACSRVNRPVQKRTATSRHECALPLLRLANLNERFEKQAGMRIQLVAIRLLVEARSGISPEASLA